MAMVKVVPSAALDSTSTLPPCAWLDRLADELGQHLGKAAFIENGVEFGWNVQLDPPLRAAGSHFIDHNGSSATTCKTGRIAPTRCIRP